MTMNEEPGPEGHNHIVSSSDDDVNQKVERPAKRSTKTPKPYIPANKPRSGDKPHRTTSGSGDGKEQRTRRSKDLCASSGSLALDGDDEDTKERRRARRKDRESNRERTRERLGRSLQSMGDVDYLKEGGVNDEEHKNGEEKEKRRAHRSRRPSTEGHDGEREVSSRAHRSGRRTVAGDDKEGSTRGERSEGSTRGERSEGSTRGERSEGSTRGERSHRSRRSTDEDKDEKEGSSRGHRTSRRLPDRARSAVMPSTIEEEGDGGDQKRRVPERSKSAASPTRRTAAQSRARAERERLRKAAGTADSSERKRTSRRRDAADEGDDNEGGEAGGGTVMTESSERMTISERRRTRRERLGVGSGDGMADSSERSTGQSRRGHRSSMGENSERRSRLRRHRNDAEENGDEGEVASPTTPSGRVRARDRRSSRRTPGGVPTAQALVKAVDSRGGIDPLKPHSSSDEESESESHTDDQDRSESQEDLNASGTNLDAGDGKGRLKKMFRLPWKRQTAEGTGENKPDTEGAQNNSPLDDLDS